jgi:AraC family transcriptional regulator
MTESTATQVPERTRGDVASRAALQSPAGLGQQAGGFLPVTGSLSRISRYRTVNDDELRPGSAPRLKIIVEELLTAVRSLLQGDRKSAESSVDRVEEMLERARAPAAVPSVPNNQGGLAPWQIRRVMAHIESHLDGPIATPDLAAVAKISIYHFTRAFRESLCETPQRYITRRRVERAQGLMLTTGLTLGNIAVDCGFADQSHLNRQFRQLMGETPGAWRRARAAPADRV